MVIFIEINLITRMLSVRKCLYILLLTPLFANQMHASEVLIISGVYQGKNLYVQNPILPDNRFSTQEVFVNDHLVLSNPMTSAYTVDLTHLEINTAVEVRIIHTERFQPKIINPHVLGPDQVSYDRKVGPETTVFRWINVDDRKLRWLAHGAGSGTFEVQKSVKEGWEFIGAIEAEPLSGESVLRLALKHKKGENNYRIKFTDRNGFVTYSDPISYKLK